MTRATARRCRTRGSAAHKISVSPTQSLPSMHGHDSCQSQTHVRHRQSSFLCLGRGGAAYASTFVFLLLFHHPLTLRAPVARGARLPPMLPLLPAAPAAV